MNPPFLPPTFPPGPPTAPAWEGGPATFPQYNGQSQTSKINIANPVPPWELGPGSADPNISKHREQYIGSGYVPITPGPQGIGVGNPVTVGPQWPAAQLRFYVQAGQLYALDNVTGQSFWVAAASVTPQPPVYAPAK